MSAPLPEGALHLLVADEGVTEGQWYGEYLTLTSWSSTRAGAWKPGHNDDVPARPRSD